MATISDRYSIHTDSNVSKNIYNNEQKKNDEDEEIKRSQLSSMDGYQGEKTTKKVNDSVQIGKTDTLSSFQSINENKKSDRMSPTSKKSSDNNTKKKNNEKTIKKSQQKEESRSTTMSSTSIGTNNIKREEVVSSSLLNNNENNRKDESTTLNNMKKRKSTSNNSDSKTKESTKLSPTNVDSKNDNAFPIQKDDAQHLTDFQLEKAKYFFNVNLDIENKEYVTWEDVEFYLLFHATAAGKEGSDGDDLEVRLNRAAKAFWEHVHDQVPLSDGKRDTLTLDQFLDTWAGLIDYVVRTNQLPPIIQDLVKLGFELYSTDNGNDKPTTIQPAAFDQLFQKMNIGRPYAIMAYKYLTENGTKPLDADKIDSLVKAVITSSDDEHDSHFLLPGFFKTIANTRNNEKDNKPQTDSSGPDEDISQTSEKSSSTSRAPSQTSTSRSQTPILHSKSRTINESLASSISQAVEQNLHSASLSKEQQKPREQQPPPAATSSPRFTQQNNSPSSPSPRFQQQPQQQQQQQQQKPSPLSIPNEQKRDISSPYQHINTPISSNNIAQSPTPSLSTSQRQNISSTSPRRQKIDIQREDENIRNLLRYYHIDDGDVVEVADGNNQRIVLIHPDRPIPSYIQDERQSLQKIKQDATMSQNGSINTPNKSNNNEKSSQEPNITESKPNITLEGRVFRGEAQKGPTIPLQQDHSQERSSSQNVRQVYPKVNEEQNEDLRKKACKRHEKHSNKNKKKNTDDTSITSDIQSSRKDEKKPKKDTSHNEEEKIVAAILKHLAPIVEQRVHEEIRRIDNDETDQDEDDNFLPFPFMLAAGLPFFSGGPNGAPPSQEPRQQQQQTSQQNAPSKEQQQNQNVPRGPDFGGAAFMPPPLFMAMMSDLARGGAGGDMPGFPHNMSSSSRGPGGAPVGVEGFMMFVDDNQMMGGTSGFPPRPGPRF
ncbi:unnamed protein product [Adineta steineri]|uniref:Uncharacterized protein n=1 Tax=Adineta steineri TaxID=433720 RepID=A0A814F0Y0_9BILA|nr:unnamed protein product [Adineta steineri]CAF0942814.1 unnamed protein product [Adineta steineri]CAF0976507.1 unnamed protein product [Adineta steineri]